MPESVNRRGSSLPTIGATVRRSWAGLGSVAMACRLAREELRQGAHVVEDLAAVGGERRRVARSRAYASTRMPAATPAWTPAGLSSTIAVVAGSKPMRSAA
jgi:hypothetical protein